MRSILILVTTIFLFGCASEPRTGPRAADRYAVIYTDGQRLAQQIFPVEVYRIDGEETLHRSGYLRLPSGTHTLRARAIVDRSLVPGLTKDLSRSGPQEITQHFQSGVRYFLGLKADSQRRANWKLVVWKEEPIEEGTLPLD